MGAANKVCLPATSGLSSRRDGKEAEIPGWRALETSFAVAGVRMAIGTAVLQFYRAYAVVP